MAQVAAHYLYTDAGLEATTWLANYMLDRGEYTAANLHFRRLIDRQGLDKVPPKGAIVIVTWPKVRNGLGFPARAFAIVP